MAAAREITIGRFNPNVSVLASGSLRASVDFVVGNATYAFATPVLGAEDIVTIERARATWLEILESVWGVIGGLGTGAAGELPGLRR